MNRQLAWTMAIALMVAACGGGDRKQDRDRPVTNPTARSTPVQRAAAGAESQPASATTEKAAPTPPAAPRPETVTPSEKLYTVQIAAYQSSAGARALAEKLQRRGLPVWTSEFQHEGRTYHRIRVGAHPSLGEMRKLGARISEEFKQDVWVAPVDGSTPIPADAVAETRVYLSR